MTTMSVSPLARRALTLVALLLAPWDAHPCKAVPSSPERLVEEADAIVHVRVVCYEPLTEADIAEALRKWGLPESARGSVSAWGRVACKVVEVLKGHAPVAELVVRGQAEIYYGPNQDRAPYRRVRRGGLGGDCYAHDYRIGADYLLFLRSGDPYWAPLAPTNEEVSASGDPWVEWVRGRLRPTATP